MRINLLPSAGAIAFLLGLTAVSQGQLTINYDFTPGSIVIDNGQLSEVKTLGGLSGLTSINDVNARLTLTTADSNNPMYLGDLYASLTFGQSGETQRTSVLLNRSGRDNTDAFGSGLSSLDVTLDDAAATNVWAATTGTGTYQADGRLAVDPNAAGVAFAAGSNGLAALNGAPLTSNQVSLLVADYSQGGTATLTSWGLSATGTAAASGTFTPGANAWIGDTGSGATNTVGATLDTTGASGGSLVVDLAGTTTFTNGVAGAGGITKNGAGTLAISGASNYTGATLVNAGKLLMGDDAADTFATSGVTVAAGATLGGSGTIAGDLVLNAESSLGALDGGKLAPGSSPGVLTVSGTTTLNTGSIFSWAIDTDTGSPGRGTEYAGLNTTSVSLSGTGAVFEIVTSDSQGFADDFWATSRDWTDIFKDAAGTSDLTNDWSTVFTSFAYSDGTNTLDPSAYGSFSWTNTGNTLTWSAVPEPTSALAGLLLATGLLRRRR